MIENVKIWFVRPPNIYYMLSITLTYRNQRQTSYDPCAKKSLIQISTNKIEMQSKSTSISRQRSETQSIVQTRTKDNPKSKSTNSKDVVHGKAIRNQGSELTHTRNGKTLQ